jgi:hypothetical protein
VHIYIPQSKTKQFSAGGDHMAAQTKPVYFNIANEKRLLDYANSLPSFGAWVKQRIREEIDKQEPIKWKLPKEGRS